MSCDQPRTAGPRLVRIAALLLLVVLGRAPVGVSSDVSRLGDRPPQTEFLTGSRFERELQRPLVATREDVGIREWLRRLSDDRQVAITLDRRIDPTHSIDVDFRDVRLQDALEQVAASVDGTAAVIGETAVIGPAASLGRIRTWIALRNAEVLDRGDALGRLTFELTRRRELRWNRLTRPVDLITRLAEEAGLTVEGLDRIPHDLWAAGALSGMDLTEAVMFVLGQFELAFEWTGGMRGIRVVDLPGEVRIEKRHFRGRHSTREAVALIRKAFPDVAVNVEGTRLVVEARIDQQEAIAELLSRRADRAPRRPAGLGPLISRRFTLTIVRQPAMALIRTLESQGVTVEYDADALEEAGVDLEQKISLKLEQATAFEFFRGFCEPLGLEFELKGTTVRLFPARGD
ncbi:hypothetical protein Mal4_26630 [Maioricimonas rarisocia]|uniref:Uncharacterized protein n=1 Tax=Maioricimonas rarisocia TaxID=2528026 RepID=A0A517Z771_9PLAN|nr:hypothetical protein [Maioricimonas rarisocia]QDU38336.1 hypothetical protein Mal4_26630 [Maioricimonas rarisocia]